jgi:hypothetical protein
MFDNVSTSNSSAFSDSWYNCPLDQTSVDNILVSLDTSGIVNCYVYLLGPSAAPGPSGLAAKTSLEGKGWTVLTN